MNDNILIEFFRYINRLVDKEKLMASLAYYGAPLFMEDKSSILFNVTKGSHGLYDIWEKYKDSVLSNEYSYYELNKTNKCINVLIYKKDRLNSILLNSEIQNFLYSYGYEVCTDLKSHLQLLSDRYKNGCPHEIGIFLDYPLNDVKSFIKDCGKNCICCGYWKVYHNESKSIKRFNAYDKAKEQVMVNILRGFDPLPEAYAYY